MVIYVAAFVGIIVAIQLLVVTVAVTSLASGVLGGFTIAVGIIRMLWAMLSAVAGSMTRACVAQGQPLNQALKAPVLLGMQTDRPTRIQGKRR